MTSLQREPRIPFPVSRFPFLAPSLCPRHLPASSIGGSAAEDERRFLVGGGTLGKRPLIRPATAGENACRGPPSPRRRRWEKSGAPQPPKYHLPPPGGGWLAAGALTCRGETGEGSLPPLLRRSTHFLHHLEGKKGWGVRRPSANQEPTASGRDTLIRPATAGENACRGPPSPRRRRWEKSGAPQPPKYHLPPPGGGWLAAGAPTCRGETGEGSLPPLLRRSTHFLHHLEGKKGWGVRRPSANQGPTASGRDPSSGPRRLVRTPVAVHLLPEGEGRRNQALPRPPSIISLSPGRGWLAAGALTCRGETGEGSLPPLLRRSTHFLHHLEGKKGWGVRRPSANQGPTASGRDPSSGPRRPVRTPVAVHLLHPSTNQAPTAQPRRRGTPWRAPTYGPRRPHPLGAH